MVCFILFIRKERESSAEESFAVLCCFVLCTNPMFTLKIRDKPKGNN